MRGAGPTLSAEARLRDPAHRDQDGPVWRRDRFAERVRRQWNVVQMSGGAAGDAELDELAAAIQAKVGGAVEAIRHRLQEFADLDEAAAQPAVDPLVRPGAPADGH
ncbi:MAG TPA: hypothetical protein VJ874_04025 [Candidatus Thermoplasmatota archaeon]|nr:hypothetical protein [Candidatus Thermoplasmatota archaeon]